MKTIIARLRQWRLRDDRRPRPHLPLHAVFVPRDRWELKRHALVPF